MSKNCDLATSAMNCTLSLEFAMEIMPILPYIGVVFPFMGSLSLGCHNSYFLMILKKPLTFLLLSNPVLQYWKNTGILEGLSSGNASGTLTGTQEYRRVPRVFICS